MMTIAVERTKAELDSEMAEVLLRLQLMPYGASTQKFDTSGHRHPESNPPAGAFRADSHPEYLYLRDEYNKAFTNLRREEVLAKAIVELESWHPDPTEILENFNIERAVVEEGEGYDAEHVAERFGIEVGYVHNLRRRAGKRADDGLPIDPTKLTVGDRRAEVKRLKYVQNLSLRQIAAILSCSTHTISMDLQAINRDVL